MREILFRGQTRRYGQYVNMAGEKQPGRWVYGGIFPGTGDFSIIYGGDKEEFTGADLGKHPVYTETVGQYTGLKDKNGKRIFEGDIVKVELHDSNDEKWCETRKVQYSEKECCWYPMRWQEYCEICNSYTDIVSIEIVGNAHDNPELLEVHHE